MTILLVDDDRATRESVSLFLRNLGHQVTCAVNGLDGLERFRTLDCHLVLTDIRMPDMDGFTMVREIRKLNRPLVDIIIITGHGDLDSAVTALREGAYDYLQKPINIEELAIIIERVSEHLSLKITNRELTTRFEEQVQARVSEKEQNLATVFKTIQERIGLKQISIHSAKLEAIFALAERFHRSAGVPVLIEGETGTGKELLAQFIHHGFGVSPKPFVAINCGAIPADLFESELFGHEAGSFTGAGTSAKKGKLELAEDGTLLLDEIGDMPLAMQVKLLRVIEEREFYRVGGVKKIPFTARVVAATNRALAAEVRKNSFRGDLFHRLNIGYIQVPPLRERREEIIPLAIDFLAQACARHGRDSFTGISRAAQQILLSLPWEGNIRQLQNALERIVLIYDGPLVEPAHLAFLQGQDQPDVTAPDTASSAAPAAATPGEVTLDLGSTVRISPIGIDLDQLVNKLVEEAMHMSNNNKTLAAKLLNISPRTISRRLERADEGEE